MDCTFAHDVYTYNAFADRIERLAHMTLSVTKDLRVHIYIYIYNFVLRVKL